MDNGFVGMFEACTKDCIGSVAFEIAPAMAWSMRCDS